MLSLLEKRANALKKAKFQQAERIEAQLTKEKNENFSDITRPRLFYVTFKYEEAHDSLMNKGFIEFMGTKIDIVQAKEPSNFYWHNIQVTPGWRAFRGTLIVLVMLAFFVVFFFVAMAAIKHKLLI